MSHLWENDHPYYCNDGNYYARGNEQPFTRYRSWAEFFESEGDSDFDMNLLFRFDWCEGAEDEGGSFTGDPNYRNGVLKLYWMGQRKGLYRWTEIEVCRNDEPVVTEFLRLRWEHLMLLWEPIASEAQAEPPQQKESKG